MNDGIRESESPAAMKVFIVEDAVNMQVALKDLVCEVAPAEIVGLCGSEAEATAWADAHPGAWELAIVDLTLEQGDGFHVVRHLAQMPGRGTVVVFSAFVTDVIRRHCHTLGATAVFHKSESTELARYIEEFSGRVKVC